MTRSESLFEAFCASKGIRFERIEEGSEEGGRTPDYRLLTQPTPVIAEVKQFDPSPEEVRLLRQLETRGRSDVFGGEPGARLRKKIDKAGPQLKRLTGGSLPGVLIIYNNVELSGRHIDRYAIKTAMYGTETVTIGYRPGTTPVVTRVGPGPHRKCTPTTHTSLSAIGALLEDGGELRLDIFHNLHATVRLDPASISGSRVRHYALGQGDGLSRQDWTPLQAS